MTTLLLQPGNVRILSLRALFFWRGTWVLDCELDPAIATAPAGKVTIQIGGATLFGKIDPRGSGVFVEFVHVRVLGGAGGWDQPVAPRHYHSDSGVSSTQVIQTTATEVGETANVTAPIAYPADFVRSAGPASRVLEGVDWWVDLAGVTQVGPRPAPKADPSLVLVKWDPTAQSAELACDALVLPGTPLSDPRIPGGPVTVRDVEQTFDGEGSRVTAWCSVAAVSQLVGDLRAMVEEFSGRKFLAGYLYRIVTQSDTDGRVQLQIVEGTDGVPDALPLSPWPGMSGDSAKFALGSTVRVAFLRGDPSQPIVDSYQPGVLPIKRTVDASFEVDVGPTAPLVALAGGAQPVALAPAITTFLSALQTWTAAVAGALSGLGTPIAGPQGALVTAIGTATSGTPATKVTAT
jgi:hypothetical protein